MSETNKIISLVEKLSPTNKIKILIYVRMLSDPDPAIKAMVEKINRITDYEKRMKAVEKMIPKYFMILQKRANKRRIY